MPTPSSCSCRNRSRKGPQDAGVPRPDRLRAMGGRGPAGSIEVPAASRRTGKRRRRTS